jgi:cytochrome P450
MVAHAQEHVADWRSGEVKDIQHEMMQLTLRIVGKTLFDADVAGDAREVGPAFATALESMQARISGLQLLLPDSVPTPTVLRLRRAVRTLDTLVYRIIAQRRTEGDDRGDLLSLLLQERDADDGQGMSDRQLRDEVMTLVLAEVLRLYPPVWATGREAVEDTRVGEIAVRRGTIVLLSPWAMQRDGRFFPEPDAFRPERWLDGLAQRLPRFAYYPFGGGPRQCIGNTFALTEGALLLATVAQRYTLALVSGETISPVPTSTLRPARPIMMQVSVRAQPTSSARAAWRSDANQDVHIR